MRTRWFFAVVLGFLVAGCSPAEETGSGDQDFLWLEEGFSEAALSWVADHNEATLERLKADDRFARYLGEAEAILTDPSRIAYGTVQDGYYYNYWQDKGHVQGVWRRSPLADFLASRPDWEILIDLDALSAAEGREWIFKSADCRMPEVPRCLVEMAHKGMDSSVFREFDMETRSFTSDEAGGFNLPEFKSSIWWEGDDSVLVATDWGPDSLNTSRYPRTIRRWTRGQELADAEILFEGEKEDAFLGAAFIGAAGAGSFIAIEARSFFNNEYWLVDADGTRKQLALPADAAIEGFFEGELLMRPNVAWQAVAGGPEYAAGSLIGIDMEDLLEGSGVIKTRLIYAPPEKAAIREVISANGMIVVNLLDHLQSRIVTLKPDGDGWVQGEIDLGRDLYFRFHGAIPGNGILIERQAPLRAEDLLLYDLKHGLARVIARQNPQFSTDGLTTTLYEATSRDGTQIPYRVMGRADAPLDGSNPTLVYGYGGFDISVTPRYEPIFGKLWMEKGGLYVHANIRGGGEFGPDWHHEALLRNREKAFEDYMAVLEDLIQRGITRPEHLGIMGRSNGGLLMGVTMTRRPDLLGAAVIGGPLIDMMRYHLLPPGASWMAEYGNPDDAGMAQVIASYSPQQNLEPGVDYPTPLIITASWDDRVLPGHARRFAAKLESMDQDVLYFEDAQGGHYWELAGGPSPGNWKLRALARTVEFIYLARMLGNDQDQTD